MNIVIKLILVALAAVFPKFKMGDGVLLITLTTLVSVFGFLGAYLDRLVCLVMIPPRFPTSTEP